jgi:hypothetical protein
LRVVKVLAFVLVAAHLFMKRNFGRSKMGAIVLDRLLLVHGTRWFSKVY